MTTVWDNDIEYIIQHDTEHNPYLVKKSASKDVITIPNIDKYHLVVHEGSLQLTTVTTYRVQNIQDYTQEIANNILTLKMKRKIVETMVTEEELCKYDLRHTYISKCVVFDKFNNVVSDTKKDYAMIIKDILKYFAVLPSTFVIRTKITIRYFMEIVKKYECTLNISFTLKTDDIIHFVTPVSSSSSESPRFGPTDP